MVYLQGIYTLYSWSLHIHLHCIIVRAYLAVEAQIRTYLAVEGISSCWGTNSRNLGINFMIYKAKFPKQSNLP